MTRWLLRQIGRAAWAAWATASLVFILSRVTAVGVEEAMLGEAGDLQTHTTSTAHQLATRQALRHRLRLDKPVFYVTRSSSPTAWHWHGTHNQYHQWLADLLRGQLGWSYRDGQPIGPQLRVALAYTFPLASLAAVLAAFGAIVLGLVLAGGQPEASTGWRVGLHLVLTGLQGTPVFALALGLLFLLANPDALDLLPAYSLGDDTGDLYALQLVLPVLTLVLAALPELALPLAAALRHELQADYATTARAKGVSAAKLLRHHALPNALLPLLTAFAGLLPTLLAGTVLVETVFALPGMGRWLAAAAAAHDYPVVVAGVLLIAGVRMLCLTLADVLYAVADPRIRFSS